MAQTSEAPGIKACLNMAVIKLSGIPRSELTTTDISTGTDGLVQINWVARDGRAGFCRVDGANQVTEFGIKASEITNPLIYGSSDWTAPAGTLVWVITDGGSLNLRSSPGGEVVGMVPNGTQLVVTGRTNSEWVQVEDGNWVSQYHLALHSGATNRLEALGIPPANINQSKTPGGAAPTRIVTSSGGSVNVRSAPEGEIIGSLDNGATIALTGRNSGDWVEIQGGGWVFSAFVQQ
ncbi:MAG: SH3 domain-containing protein [Elainella sp.]